jgi:ADP-heptose:LPS heptosyltransferase
MDETVRNILVYVDGDLMGDGLMKLPMIRALRGGFPHAHISWCAGRHRSIFARDLAPFVRGLIDEVIEDAALFRQAGSLFRRPLDGRHFDIVIDTQSSLFKTMLLRRVRHKRFISHAAGFLLSDRRPGTTARRALSLSERLTGLAGLAVGVPEESLICAPLPVDESAALGAAAVLPPGPVYVGFAPGAGGRHKCWPLAQYLTAARLQLDRGRVPVFILGPAEAAWADQIDQALPGCIIPASNGAAVGQRGSDSPGFTVAVARRLAAAVANDSGCGHLLAAADVPLVSLFGATNAGKFRPACRRLEAIEAAAFGAGGIGEIPVSAVSEALERLLSH